VLHDRDAKFYVEFRETLTAEDVKCLPLPPRSPNLNAFAEGWARSVKEECLSKADLVRGSFVEESANPIPRTLP
jgi:hypothetical protein